MQLNLTDPESIVLWWRVFPERHWDFLEGFELRSPQFRPAIREARRRIQADPLFRQVPLRDFPTATDGAFSAELEALVA